MQSIALQDYALAIAAPPAAASLRRLRDGHWVADRGLCSALVLFRFLFFRVQTMKTIKIIMLYFIIVCDSNNKETRGKNFFSQGQRIV